MPTEDKRTRNWEAGLRDPQDGEEISSSSSPDKAGLCERLLLGETRPSRPLPAPLPTPTSTSTSQSDYFSARA